MREPLIQKPGESEELAHVDDAIIGKAFRWSLVGLALVLIAGASVVVWLKRKPASTASRLTRMTAPVSPERPRAAIPMVKFTDVTGAAGIGFVHENGAYGEKLLPEAMGGGV